MVIRSFLDICSVFCNLNKYVNFFKKEKAEKDRNSDTYFGQFKLIYGPRLFPGRADASATVWRRQEEH